jgi:hypothetical protein
VYRETVIDANLKTGKISKKNRSDWEKCIEEAKVGTGLQ